MILIKNPAGCNQVLNFLTNTTTPAVFVACLNDRAQDGKDISWIWDVDFEKLLGMGDMLKDVYVSGVRADDLALRFEYAGHSNVEKIHVQSGLRRARGRRSRQQACACLCHAHLHRHAGAAG